MNLLIILMRFAITFIGALIFGLDRQRAHKPVGFGTFIYVSVGSCGLAIASLLLNVENPLPLLAAIITGIGFLGAGALIKTADKIFGFSSAASIWIFAIFGLVIGVGNYFIGILLYAFVWCVILIDRHLERRGIGSYQKSVMIVANRNIKTEDIEAVLKTRRYKIVLMEVNKKTSQINISLLLEGTKVDLNKVPKRLFKTDWVDSFKIE